MYRVLALALVAAAAFAQTAPSFEVATVRVPAPNTPYSLDVAIGSLTIRNARMRTILRWAYNVQEPQIVGPDALIQMMDQQMRFDISAKAATPATEDELRLMMQTLLAERFQLQVRRENREIPAFALTVGKGGHKLKPPSGEGPPRFTTGNMNLTGERATIAQLTEFLARQLRAPIIDQTNLAGPYDYFLDILADVTPEVLEGARGGRVPLEAPAIIGSGLQGQLGLKLDALKGPVPVVVVDRIVKEPSEN
jgi:uncharacterized protein (TIGR03435 family)